LQGFALRLGKININYTKTTARDFPRRLDLRYSNAITACAVVAQPAVAFGGLKHLTVEDGLRRGAQPVGCLSWANYARALPSTSHKGQCPLTRLVGYSQTVARYIKKLSIVVGSPAEALRWGAPTITKRSRRLLVDNYELYTTL
jgi:hypothetical protein